MAMSSNGTIFRVTGSLWGESTGHQWIPLTKASDMELWCFLWSTPEQTVEQTIKMLVIWDAIALIQKFKIHYDVTVMYLEWSVLKHFMISNLMIGWNNGYLKQVTCKGW